MTLTTQQNERLIDRAPDLLKALETISNGIAMVQGEYSLAMTILAYQKIASNAIKHVKGE